MILSFEPIQAFYQIPSGYSSNEMSLEVGSIASLVFGMDVHKIPQSKVNLANLKPRSFAANT